MCFSRQPHPPDPEPAGPGAGPFQRRHKLVSPAAKGAEEAKGGSEVEYVVLGVGMWVGTPSEGHMDLEPKTFLPHDRRLAPPSAPPRKVEVERCASRAHAPLRTSLSLQPGGS